MNDVELVGVVGSRGYPDLGQVVREVQKLGDVRVLSGGAKGVDQVAEAVAQGFTSYRPFKHDYGNYLIQVVEMPEERVWTWGEVLPSFARAAHFRNDIIIRRASRMLIFYDGSSPGTTSIIEKVEANGMDYKIFTRKAA